MEDVLRVPCESRITPVKPQTWPPPLSAATGATENLQSEGPWNDLRHLPLTL